MEYLNLKALTASVVYSVLGIIILFVSFYVFNKLTPGTLWHKRGAGRQPRVHFSSPRLAMTGSSQT